MLLSLLCLPLSAPSAYIVYRLLKKPSLLATVFNKHIALDLALSGEQSTDVIPNHDGSPSKACLLPWAAAALLLLLYGGLELGRVKTLVIILQMTFVPISSSKILIFICAIPFR